MILDFDKNAGKGYEFMHHAFKVESNHLNFAFNEMMLETSPVCRV